jgi:hypothetical protein
MCKQWPNGLGHSWKAVPHLLLFSGLILLFGWNIAEVVNRVQEVDFENGISIYVCALVSQQHPKMLLVIHEYFLIWDC